MMGLEQVQHSRPRFIPSISTIFDRWIFPAAGIHASAGGPRSYQPRRRPAAENRPSKDQGGSKTMKKMIPILGAAALCLWMVAAAPSVEAAQTLCPCMFGCNVISGTSGADVINGLSTCDCIRGLGGNDEIHGNGGDDNICAGDGRDGVEGDDGDDLILGERGDDALFGDAGNDFINGGADDDTLDGGSGTDTLNGGTGFDICRNGPTFSNCEITL
jgi:hypothetical protein